MRTYLDVKQLAAHFCVAPNTIWRWKREGKFPVPILISKKCTRWLKSDIEEFEESLMEARPVFNNPAKKSNSPKLK